MAGRDAKEKMAAGVLDALEDLQRRQERLLNEMLCGRVDAGEIPPAQSAPIGAQPPPPQTRTQPQPQPQTPPQTFRPVSEPCTLPLFPDISMLDPRRERSPGLKPAGANQSDIPTNISAKQATISSKPPKSSPKKRVRAGGIISAALFYGFLIILVGGAFLISRGDKKPVFGYSFMNVLTWSMQSEIPQGSMVVIKRVDTGTLKIGDDITYMKDAKTSVTHRVVGIIEDYEDTGRRGFRTQGVENDTPDFEIVPAVNVVGKVALHIPKLGSWLQWLNENLIITLLFTAGLILLVFLLRGALRKGPEQDKKSGLNPRGTRLQATL